MDSKYSDEYGDEYPTQEYLKAIDDGKVDVAPHLGSFHDKVNFTCGYVAGAKKVIKLIGGRV